MRSFAIDEGSATPPFEQIKQQIARARDTGELPPNHRLPTVRQLAADLGLAPNTVAKAYRELEASGVIETRGRRGSFVIGTAEGAERAGAAAARAYLAETRALGLPDAHAVSLVRDALDDR